MSQALTIVVVRSGGRAPLTLRMRARSVLTLVFAATAITLACVWAGWQIGELTFAM